MNTNALRTLLALCVGSFLLTIGCIDDPNMDDDDTSVSDDDDTVTEYGTVILDATLPNVDLTLTPVNGGQERSILSCTTVCEMTSVPVGDYEVTGVVTNGLIVPQVISVTTDEICEETIMAGLAPNGSYRKYDNPDGEGEPLNGTTYAITTTVEPLFDEWSVVHLRLPGIGGFEVEGSFIFTGEQEAAGEISSDLEVITKVNTVSPFQITYFIRQ